jgi:hypothetical protein
VTGVAGADGSLERTSRAGIGTSLVLGFLSHKVGRSLWICDSDLTIESACTGSIEDTVTEASGFGVPAWGIDDCSTCRRFVGDVPDEWWSWSEELWGV